MRVTQVAAASTRGYHVEIGDRTATRPRTKHNSEPIMSSNDSLGAVFIEDTLLTFRRQRELAERALAQVTDEDFFRTIDAESNSVAILVKHIGGNLVSRWTDFLTSDGEKPTRNRDGEFIVVDGSNTAERAGIMSLWNEGWDTLSNTLTQLRPEDLLATIRIRGEAMTALAAIHRGIAHISQHVGQIVLLAKHYRSADWKTLSIPRGQSGNWQAPASTTAR